MHIHSLVALTLAATTSALPSLPECLLNDENHSRACREVGPAQSKQEIVDGQKQQNRGGLRGQIEYVDQQVGKEIECPECGKNIVGDLTQSGSIGHNKMVTGQGEQQLDMINGKTHEEWIGMGQKQEDYMPHGQKSNFNIGQNQKRNQHFGQLYNGQSNTHGSMNMDSGKTHQDELITKGQGMTQELYNGMGQNNGRIQERDNTHNWGNQLFQGQNQEQHEQFMTGQGQNHQQEQFNKGTQQMEGLYNTGSNANGIIQDFNKGGQNQQLYNGQQMSGINQLYKIGQDGILMAINPDNHQQEHFNKGQGIQGLYNGQHQQQQWKTGPNDILMTTRQLYQGQPINTQQLSYNKGQGIQQLYNGQQMGVNQLYKSGQDGILMTTPFHEQEQFNKGQQTQEMFKNGQTNNAIQARNEIPTQTGIAEQFTDSQNKQHQQIDGQSHQGQEMLSTGPVQSKPLNEEWTIQNGKSQQEQIDGQKQGQEMNFISSSQSTQQEQFAGQNTQGQQELFTGNAQSKQTEQWVQNSSNQQEHVVFSPQQMMDFISGQTKQGQQWIREQMVRDGKQQAVWICVN